MKNLKKFLNMETREFLLKASNLKGRFILHSNGTSWPGSCLNRNFKLSI